MYTAYVLSDESIREIKEKYNPLFPDFIGHHITCKFGNVSKNDIPDPTDNIEIIGYSSDDSLECFVCRVDGSVRREDGNLYHLTWSLDRASGRKPVDSNELLNSLGYFKIPSIKLKTTPKLLK